MNKKSELEEARKKAKELEQKPLKSMENIVDIYKEGMEEAEKLRKLLRPEWFIDDKCKHKITKKIQKNKKKPQKKTTSTRKKKGL